MATQWVVAHRGHAWFAYEEGAPAFRDRRFPDRESAISWCLARGYEVRADSPDAGVTLSPGDNGGGDVIADRAD
jgi:hypothetical protein